MEEAGADINVVIEEVNVAAEPDGDIYDGDDIIGIGRTTGLYI